MNPVPSDCLAQGHRRLSTIRRSLSADILRFLNKSPENRAAGDNLRTRLGAFLTPQLLCLLLYRIAHYLHVNGWGRLAVLVTRLNLLIHKVNISPQSCIGAGCFLPHPVGVTFHGTAGRGLTLYSLCVCCPREPGVDGPAEAGPRLGHRVTVGGHAVLLGPITVGDDTKVAPKVCLDREAPAAVLVVSKAVRSVHVPSRPGRGSP
ncbi:MAG TPA: hypothetical protein VM389_10170 [Phycisphaerae bacterium]|nr:hypothetical protein [Phycisphaerae bacterium]